MDLVWKNLIFELAWKSHDPVVGNGPGYVNLHRFTPLIHLENGLHGWIELM